MFENLFYILYINILKQKDFNFKVSLLWLDFPSSACAVTTKIFLK